MIVQDATLHLAIPEIPFIVIELEGEVPFDEWRPRPENTATTCDVDPQGVLLILDHGWVHGPIHSLYGRVKSIEQTLHVIAP